jgi:Fe2+ or Zn2+ uptake regulation protein
MKKTDFMKTLRDHGLKVTDSRLVILSSLESSYGPMSVEEIHRALKTPVDLVSVYRNLDAFTKSGIVREIDLRRGSSCYELAHDHHHHIVCTSCGLIEKFDGCIAEKALAGIVAKSKKFKTISDHSFELFGLCSKCATL